MEKQQPGFRTDFDPLDPNLGPEIFFMDFASTACSTLFQAIIACNCKEN